MHRHNRKYGYSKLLREYCGASASDPILGEVQHSLFLSPHHFRATGQIGPPRKTGALWFPFFAWNDLIRFRNQVPIGDPLLYSREVLGLKGGLSNSAPTLPLVMPKFNEELNLESRLAGYQDLILHALEFCETPELNVAIHPRDIEGARALGRKWPPQVNFLNLSSPSPIVQTLASLEQMSRSSAIISDYFGAHVFRGALLFDVPTFVVNGNLAEQLPLAAKVVNLLREYNAPAASREDKLIVAQEFLGSKFFRDPDELRALLFRPATPTGLRKALVYGYKVERRMRVRLRKSSLVGSSGVARFIRSKFLRPKWARYFLREARLCSDAG